jgi:hypothetical protein
VKRSSSERRSSRKGPHRRMHSIFNGGSARNPKRLRQIVCQTFHNDRVAAERQVRPVLFGRADRDDQAGSLQQALAHRAGGHLF